MLGIPAFQMETSRFSLQNVLIILLQEKHSQKNVRRGPFWKGENVQSHSCCSFCLGFSWLKLRTFSPPNIPAFTKIGKKSWNFPPHLPTWDGRVNFRRQLKERYDNFKEAFEAFDPRFGPAALRWGKSKNCSVTRIRGGGNSNEFSFHFQPLKK